MDEVWADSFDVDWDFVHNCYCLHYQGEIICLGGEDYNSARFEAETIIENWGS